MFPFPLLIHVFFIHAYAISSDTQKGGENIYFKIAIGILLPLLGTVLGSALVFFARRKRNALLGSSVEGFCDGVMVAASVWSLIIPAIALAEKRGEPPSLFVSLGILAGIVFFILSERVISRFKNKYFLSDISNSAVTCLAIALHNLPEGMAVGAVFAEAITAGTDPAFYAAVTLSVGIAVQNFPEGAIVSMPLFSSGETRAKAFLFGALSGIVEPVGAILTLFALGIAVPLLPFLFGFAAGAMLYAVINGLLSSSAENFDLKKRNMRFISFAMGFILMMSLDVILG